MAPVNKIIINQHYSDINPRLCGMEECTSGHYYGPTTRELWLLHFVVSGKGKFKTERGEYQLGENDMFVIRPYDVTYYEADKKDPWTYIWIGFSCDTKLPDTLLENDVLHVPFLANIFRDCFSAEDLPENGRGYEAYVCAAIWQMISLLEKRELYSMDMTEHYIRSALDIIDSEYATGITVEDIAARLHLNRSYFSTMFTKIMGVTPKDKIASVRMHKAAELLCERSFDVSVVARSMGFPDVFSFSRAFKRYHKLSPTEYRDRERSKKERFGEKNGE